jgi:hypothetical protein
VICKGTSTKREKNILTIFNTGKKLSQPQKKFSERKFQERQIRVVIFSISFNDKNALLFPGRLVLDVGELKY